MRLDWKAVIGVCITVFLLWWILRDVPFGEVWTQIRRAHLGLLLAAITVATAGFLIRALRWKVLLQPVRADTSLRNRFAAVNIGFMANNLLPARVGEFARAYALSKVEPISMSAALGSLVVERILDALVLMAILLAAIFSPSFPASAQLSGGPLGAALNAVVVLLLVLVVIITFLLVMPRTVVRGTERLARVLPGDLARPIVSALEAFLGSLNVFRSPKLLLLGVIWSVGFWLWHGLSFWLAMLAFDIHAGPVAAYFTEPWSGSEWRFPRRPGSSAPFTRQRAGLFRCSTCRLPLRWHSPSGTISGASFRSQ